MGLLMAGAIQLLAKGALTAVIAPFVEEAREVALNAAQDTIRSAVAGRMSVEEWADIAIEGVDKIKDTLVSENGLRFIGGKLKFAVSSNTPETVSVSFELYFLDEQEQWQKADADTDIPHSKFTVEALAELQAKGEISFEVE